MGAKLIRILLFCIAIGVNCYSNAAVQKLSQDFNGTGGVLDSQFVFNLTGNRILYFGIFPPETFDRLYSVLPNGQNRIVLSEPLAPNVGNSI